MAGGVFAYIYVINVDLKFGCKSREFLQIILSQQPQSSIPALHIWRNMGFYRSALARVEDTTSYLPHTAQCGARHASQRDKRA